MTDKYRYCHASQHFKHIDVCEHHKWKGYSICYSCLHDMKNLIPLPKKGKSALLKKLIWEILTEENRPMTSEEIAYKIRTKYSYDVRNTNVLSCTKGGTFLKDGKKFVSHERDIDTHKQQNESSDFEKPTKKTRKRKSNEDTIPVPIHMKPEKKEIKHKRKQAKKKEDISVPEILIDEIVPKELETKTPKKQQKKQKKIKEKSGNQTSQKPITNDKSNMSPNKITRKNRLMEISV